MKKVLLVLVTFIFCIASILSLKADSGWDSDYDSGWDSDWDSGSSWDSDWDNDNSSSSYSHTPKTTYKYVTNKTTYNDYIEITDNEEKYTDDVLTDTSWVATTYVYLNETPELYEELEDLSSKVTKNIFCDMITLGDAYKTVRISKDEYEGIYESLKTEAPSDANYKSIYDDRIEISDNCVKQIVYKSENPELYEQLKKEIKRENLRVFLTAISFFLTPAIFIIFFIVLATKTKKNIKNKISYNKPEYNSKPEGVSKETLEEFGINEEEFINNAFDNFVKVQEGWMNFKYEELKDLLTDELYNTYSSQLSALEIKEEQNIMEDFDFIDGKITKIYASSDTITVETYMEIDMFDYVVDKDKKVVRGSKDHKLTLEYMITYVKPLVEKDYICPSCGAKLTKINGKCEYCRTLIVRPSNEFVMSKKTCIRQRRN